MNKNLRKIQDNQPKITNKIKKIAKMNPNGSVDKIDARYEKHYSGRIPVERIMEQVEIVECISVWKKLGRVVHVQADPVQKKVFSLAESFVGPAVIYKIASFDYGNNLFCGFVRGKFEEARYVSICPSFDLIAGNIDNFIGIWRMSTGQLICKSKVAEKNINHLSLSEDGQFLFVNVDKNRIYVLNTDTCELVYELKGFLRKNDSFIISPTKKIIIGRDRQNYSFLKAWDYLTGQELWEMDTSLDLMTAIVPWYNSDLLAISQLNGTISLWDVLTNQKIDSFQLNRQIGTMSLSLNEKFLIFGDRNGGINILNLKSKENIRLPFHNQSRVEAISIIDEQHFVSAGWNGSAIIWRFRS